MSTTTGRVITEDELNALDNAAVVCGAVQPGTLGYQTCWRIDEHDGDHYARNRRWWADGDELAIEVCPELDDDDTTECAYECPDCGSGHHGDVTGTEWCRECTEAING